MPSVLYIGTLLFTLLLTGPAAWAEPATRQSTTSPSAPGPAGEGRHLAIYIRFQFRYEAPKEKSYEQPPRMRNLLEELLVSEINPPGARLALVAFTEDPLLTQDARLRGEPWLRAIDFGIDDVILIEATFRLALLDQGGTADFSGVVQYLNVAENQVVRQRPFSLREEISADSPTGFEMRRLLLQDRRAYSPKDLAAALLAAAERRLKARMEELVQRITATYAPLGFPTLHDPILMETLWRAAEERAASAGDPESAKDFIRRLQEHFPQISQAAWAGRMRRVREAAAANASRGDRADAARETPGTPTEGKAWGRRAQPTIRRRSAAKGVVRSSQTGPGPARSDAPNAGRSTASNPSREFSRESGEASRGALAARPPLDLFRGIRLETPVASVGQKYRLSRVSSDRRALPAYTIDFDPGKDLVQSIRVVAPRGRIAKITVLFSREFGQMRHWAFPATVQFFSAGYGRPPSTARGLAVGTRQVGRCAEWEDGGVTVTLSRFDDIGLGQPLSPPLLVLTISRRSTLLQRGVLDGCSQWDEVASAPR